MMAINPSFSEIASAINPILAPITAGLNTVENKSKSPFIRTLCKVVQVIPPTLIAICLLDTGTIERKMGRKFVCDMQEYCLFFLPSLPVINALIKEISDYKAWKSISTFLHRFDTAYMTLAKTINIGVIILGIVKTFITRPHPYSDFCIPPISFPTYMVLISAMLLLNIYITVKSVLQTNNNG